MPKNRNLLRQKIWRKRRANLNERTVRDFIEIGGVKRLAKRFVKLMHKLQLEPCDDTLTTAFSAKALRWSPRKQAEYLTNRLLPCFEVYGDLEIGSVANWALIVECFRAEKVFNRYAPGRKLPFKPGT